jgi:acyl-CoA synthetase (AMP-forming)/AMP-acid ligase II
MEVESALVDHPAVAEAAVVGRAHEIKGQAIAAFVTLKEGANANLGSKKLIDELKEHVVKKIGAIARPDDIIFTAIFRKRAPVRSCAASCPTSPRARRSAIRRRLRSRPSSRS